VKYLEKKFSVPAGSTAVTQEEWDRIFGDDPAPEKSGGTSEKTGLTELRKQGSIIVEEEPRDD
jgi:hypothetical protein